MSGWVEGRAIDAANSFNVSKFLCEEVVCRHGCPRRIVLRENMDMMKDLLEDYQIQNTVISAYHPQMAGLVERGHGPIVNSLMKYCWDVSGSWPKHLSLALCGRKCLLLVELMIESWQTVDWEAMESREDLILERMQQLDHC